MYLGAPSNTNSNLGHVYIARLYNPFSAGAGSNALNYKGKHSISAQPKNSFERTITVSRKWS